MTVTASISELKTSGKIVNNFERSDGKSFPRGKGFRKGVT